MLRAKLCVCVCVCVRTMVFGLFNQQYALCVLVGGNIICNRSFSNCPTGSQT